MKNKNDFSKGFFTTKKFDLHRIQINKGNFAQMLNVNEN